MDRRHEQAEIKGLPAGGLRLLHISDVHFSSGTSRRSNQQVIQSLVEILSFYTLDETCPIGAVCMTGDLVSRKHTQESFADALTLMQRLREFAPVLYSMGNHEYDWEEPERTAFFRQLAESDITVLDNASAVIGGVTFTGLTLPQTVYKHPGGSYRDLTPITVETVEKSVGSCKAHPTVLLAHTPLGFPAYAKWGADAVLAGHVHGGIVRLGGIGFLSPERKFFPKYTKGLYDEGTCIMNVSAGIGKFRLNNPAEAVCIDLRPVSGR